MNVVVSLSNDGSMITTLHGISAKDVKVSKAKNMELGNNGQM